ncbi:hypothetical protein ACFOON_15255 [Novosphingobium piscinae]|uniref:Uncharacterized protein n=1 Tax=Novosphingobium piscinae TaxID=1507448 RepID=A0A7X1KPR5_9SPHN|nr:hypothetical protein [Novosphingobium piscinae]MBC2668743.1 hypothetical protein [Novosphingobium piscinae]
MIPAPPRKTLLEWIEADDADTPDDAAPVCTASQQRLYAAVASTPEQDNREPLAPPPGLALALLG